jgi:glycosyltransferase 2 family protein
VNAEDRERGAGAPQAAPPGRGDRLRRLARRAEARARDPRVRAAGFVVSLALVAYVAVRAAHSVHPRELAWWPLALGFVVTGAWWVLLARGWALLVSGRTTHRDVSVWCRTQALRYLPGGIWGPASRVTVAPGRLLGRVSVVAAENVISLCAALAIGGVALAASGQPWWIPLALALALPALAVRVLPERAALDPVRVRAATWNYLLAFGLYVGSAVFVQAAVSGFHHELLVAGAAGVSWGVGLVVVAAPGGIGVRELVYVGLASHAFASGQLAAGAVTMRLEAIVAELLVLIVAGRPRLRPAEAVGR